MLTEEKVAAGFKAAGERMNQFEITQQEIKEALNNLSKNLKFFGQAVARGNMENGQPYNSFWGNEELAKQFGEIVLRALRNKDMDTSGVSGGSVIPEILLARIIQKLGVYGKFRKNTLLLPLSTGRVMVPKIEADLTVYCPGEDQNISESDISFSQVALTPRTLCCLSKVSTEMEEDMVIGLGEIVATSLTRSMARVEDLIAFQGDGTSTYFGMKGICGAMLAITPNIANIPGLTVGSGSTWGSLALTDFEKVAGNLPPQADDNAKWYVSKPFYYQVMWRLAQSTGLANMFDILSNQKSKYFMGYEVEFVPAMPATTGTSQICALLADLQLGSFLGQRRELIIQRSQDVFFSNNQIGIRGSERIDVNAFGVGDTTEPGAIVGLITCAQ